MHGILEMHSEFIHNQHKEVKVDSKRRLKHTVIRNKSFQLFPHLLPLHFRNVQ